MFERVVLVLGEIGFGVVVEEGYKLKVLVLEDNLVD